MNEPSDPKNDPLRNLLRSARPEPTLPPRFQEGVWRRLEKDDSPGLAAPSAIARLESLIERLLLPRFALASLAVLLVAGGVTGILTSGSVAKAQAQGRYLSAVAPDSVR
jgi:hypothetical protein